MMQLAAAAPGLFMSLFRLLLTVNPLRIVTKIKEKANQISKALRMIILSVVLNSLAPVLTRVYNIRAQGLGTQGHKGHQGARVPKGPWVPKGQWVPKAQGSPRPKGQGPPWDLMATHLGSHGQTTLGSHGNPPWDPMGSPQGPQGFNLLEF